MTPIISRGTGRTRYQNVPPPGRSRRDGRFRDRPARYRRCLRTVPASDSARRREWLDGGASRPSGRKRPEATRRRRVDGQGWRVTRLSSSSLTRAGAARSENPSQARASSRGQYRLRPRIGQAHLAPVSDRSDEEKRCGTGSGSAVRPTVRPALPRDAGARSAPAPAGRAAGHRGSRRGRSGSPGSSRPAP